MDAVDMRVPSSIHPNLCQMADVAPSPSQGRNNAQRVCALWSFPRLRSGGKHGVSGDIFRSCIVTKQIWLPAEYDLFFSRVFRKIEM